MQDAGRFPPHKLNPNGEAASDAARAKSEKDGAGKPALKVSFERPEMREALKSADTAAGKTAAHVALVPEPAPANSYSSDAAPAKDAKGQGAPGPDSKIAESKNQSDKTSGTFPLLAKPDTSDAEKAGTGPSPRAIPSTAQLITAPLLAIVAALSLLAAGWSTAKLRETNAQLAITTEALTSATAEKAAAVKAKLSAEKALADASVEKASAAQAKVSAEKALADAQARLASVEKSVADIKAALAAIVTDPAPANGP